MNFLAHLHLAQRAQSSLLGNLMVDFIRDDQAGLYSPDIVAGIRLHHQVDKYTYQHPIVINAKQLFAIPSSSADHTRFNLGPFSRVILGSN